MSLLITFLIIYLGLWYISIYKNECDCHPNKFWQKLNTNRPSSYIYSNHCTLMCTAPSIFI